MPRSASQIAEDVLLKVAAELDAYGNVAPPPVPYIPTALGGALGGLAAHLMPTDKARELREMAKSVPLDVETWRGGLREGGKATKFDAPPEIVKKFYQNKALRANALRMLGLVGAGALGGYGLSQIMSD